MPPPHRIFRAAHQQQDGQFIKEMFLQPTKGMYSVLSLSGVDVLVEYSKVLAYTHTRAPMWKDTEVVYVSPAIEAENLKKGTSFTVFVGEVHYLVKVVELLSERTRDSRLEEASSDSSSDTDSEGEDQDQDQEDDDEDSLFCDHPAPTEEVPRPPWYAHPSAAPRRPHMHRDDGPAPPKGNWRPTHSELFPPLSQERLDEMQEAFIRAAQAEREHPRRTIRRMPNFPERPSSARTFEFEDHTRRPVPNDTNTMNEAGDPREGPFPPLTPGEYYHLDLASPLNPVPPVPMLHPHWNLHNRTEMGGQNPMNRGRRDTIPLPQQPGTPTILNGEDPREPRSIPRPMPAWESTWISSTTNQTSSTNYTTFLNRAEAGVMTPKTYPTNAVSPQLRPNLLFSSPRPLTPTVLDGEDPREADENSRPRPIPTWESSWLSYTTNGTGSSSEHGYGVLLTRPEAGAVTSDNVNGTRSAQLSPRNTPSPQTPASPPAWQGSYSPWGAANLEHETALLIPPVAQPQIISETYEPFDPNWRIRYSSTPPLPVHPAYASQVLSPLTDEVFYPKSTPSPRIVQPIGQGRYTFGLSPHPASVPTNSTPPQRLEQITLNSNAWSPRNIQPIGQGRYTFGLSPYSASVPTTPTPPPQRLEQTTLHSNAWVPNPGSLVHELGGDEVLYSRDLAPPLAPRLSEVTRYTSPEYSPISSVPSPTQLPRWTWKGKGKEKEVQRRVRLAYVDQSRRKSA